MSTHTRDMSSWTGVLFGTSFASLVAAESIAYMNQEEVPGIFWVFAVLGIVFLVGFVITLNLTFLRKDQ